MAVSPARKSDVASADQPAEFREMFHRIFQQAEDLCIRKHAAYGPGNISKFGLTGVVVRMSDKIERLINLTFANGTATTDESLEDTLLDLANYAAIGLACQRGWWTREGCPPLTKKDRS